MENPNTGTHPQLKRVRRPINRPQPQEGSLKDNEKGPAVGQNLSEPSASKSESQTIDDYLDEPAFPVKKQTGIYPQSKEPFSPEYLDEEAYQEEVYGLRAPATYNPGLSTKVFILGIIVALFMGIVAGKFLFAESKVVRNGLQGVVVNAEVPRGRARCGIAERSQGCVLYLMNPQRQDLRGKDFYELAARMTGRQEYMIQTGNMRYANTKIKPGDIAQLNIPPL